MNLTPEEWRVLMDHLDKWLRSQLKTHAQTELALLIDKLEAERRKQAKEQ